MGTKHGHQINVYGRAASKGELADLLEIIVAAIRQGHEMNGHVGVTLQEGEGRAEVFYCGDPGTKTDEDPVPDGRPH